MGNHRRSLTARQRDRLLHRAGRLRAWGEASRRRRPAFSTSPGRERRYIGVAARLERYVAGVARRDSTVPLIERATRRHIEGHTGYGEWIEELRWAGLAARPGHTRLGASQAAERQSNLDRRYPRIRRKTDV